MGITARRLEMALSLMLTLMDLVTPVTSPYWPVSSAVLEACPARVLVASMLHCQGRGPAMSTVEQLKELAALRDSGVLTDAEFEQQKAKILAG